jgi:signal transduction histidine kinase
LFKICARTVLELGAELISSDVIALYELIKNAFDAASPTGAEIHFEVALRRNQYLEHRRRVTAEKGSLSTLKGEIKNALDPSAPPETVSRFQQRIDSAKNQASLLDELDQAYARDNRIIVSDQGSGMSHEELIDNYLVIGTSSRKKAIDAVLARGNGVKGRPPFLGEKGIGRLSAMRLGNSLTVETARNVDSRMNVLEIDWSAFSDLDAMLDEVPASPRTGDFKPEKDWSGTHLIISHLAADWTQERVRHLAEYDFARLTDPFSPEKRRPRIAIFWNGNRVPVARMDRHLLQHAHACVTGSYHLEGKEPVLECEFTALDLGFSHPRESDRRRIEYSDLLGSICGPSGDIPSWALSQLGGFSFEAYWFNRRRLTGIDGIGDQEAVRKLQQRWAGILLFRDGFRVLPYGEDDDDWLALDRRALGTTAYLLNKAQFVGRVNISRFGNPALIDQTNREGLRVCPEQQAFVSILQLTIQSQFRDFLRDVEKRYKDQPLDLSEARTDVDLLEKRANTAFNRIKKIAPEASGTLDELQNMFLELKEFFERSQRRIAEVDSENRQMIQMAGVGLLVEVVAHELARSTENALATLEALRAEQVPDQVAGLLESLRAEMRTLNKRIRVLDPLSVSGRQRKEVFDVGDLLDDILSGHAAQFERHGVELRITKPDHGLRIRTVKGMIVQIVENLLSNSIYWLDLRKEREARFRPEIAIRLQADPFILTYEDNGPGIALENREKVFRAFFSLKEKTKRRGLGLFIARECAQYLGGSLTLDEGARKDGRLARFVVELPDEVALK